MIWVSVFHYAGIWSILFIYNVQAYTKWICDYFYYTHPFLDDPWHELQDITGTRQTPWQYLYTYMLLKHTASWKSWRCPASSTQVEFYNRDQKWYINIYIYIFGFPSDPCQFATVCETVSTRHKNKWLDICLFSFVSFWHLATLMFLVNPVENSSVTSRCANTFGCDP